MAQLDFAKLLEPYSAPTVEGGPQRTVAGQRVWLVQQKRVPPDVVDASMQIVYARMARGKKFENGHALDIYLLKECSKQLHAREKALDRLHQVNINKVLAVMKPTAWYKNMAWAVGGGGIAWVVTNFVTWG